MNMYLLLIIFYSLLLYYYYYNLFFSVCVCSHFFFLILYFKSVTVSVSFISHKKWTIASKFSENNQFKVVFQFLQKKSPNIEVCLYYSLVIRLWIKMLNNMYYFWFFPVNIKINLKSWYKLFKSYIEDMSSMQLRKYHLFMFLCT